ncbi:hypothetical protein I545_0311 [Mycobacterium kansasii 662]|uniref:Uncharacterized protein n=2 Tax=Mycobacterium kansasii TaxID=1768 RepID=A0A1V3WKP4_MYCKA|nr:hypothetical protein I547_1105 [Mycobacterium kansasii 824]EUA22236.1 hypothetical protein I545_0311 [Mycobacterium kansasii 662]OOK67530.1 hypothetical protein BZL30_7537 [Mycobacterium kansasii]OOK84417.1 hypothetical protein BZL29_0321 [Mycobacterium kansasii]
MVIVNAAVNDVLVCSLGCLALFRHTDTALSLKPLVVAGVRGMSHVLTGSALMPPYRVRSDGFDCACRAGKAPDRPP